MTVKESHEILINDESDRLIEQDKIIKAAKTSTENNGIVFLDEIDKISGRTDRVGGDVSREGVQRDLLPLIEGTTVNTKIWSDQDRSYSIYCIRCIPACKAI